MKFKNNEPETNETEEETPHLYMIAPDFRVQMEEGEMLKSFLLFLGEGKERFAKYGYLTFDTQGLRAITISNALNDDIEEYAMDNPFENLMFTAFREEECTSITFDIAFLPEIQREALEVTLMLYFDVYECVENNSFDKTMEA